MTFYDEMKALCEKYGYYAGVYVRPKDKEDAENRHVLNRHVFCITDTDNPTITDVGMTFETTAYFINAIYWMSKNKFYATHIILDVLSMVIKSYDGEKDE